MTKATLSELRAMHERGEISAPTSVPETDMPDGFWDSAKKAAAVGETTQELLARLAGFTDGPWIKGNRFDSIIAMEATGHDDVRSVEAYSGHLICESVKLPQNAALIAAAPDLHRIASEQQAEILRLRKELRRLEVYFDIDAEEYASLPNDDHRADNDRQLRLIRAALAPTS